ncbi:MAG: hypothetical protein GC179_28605 [Anaerolineaceae bacterium]|nr:hypothetical protein [Anaerolineaceae bacterium]
MGIVVQWDNAEQTVIHFVYSGQWTFGDLFDVMQDARVLMDSVDHPVHGIIDLRDSKLMPNGVLSLGRIVTMRKHHNQGKSIIVGANGFARTLYDVYRKVYRTTFDESSYAFASSLDEARQMLNDYVTVVN